MPSAAKLLAGASGVPTDPNFRNVTLLLHGDGSNGAQNNTFIDSSTNNFTITRNGNTTQGSLSPYGSRWSNYFNGALNNLLTVAPATAIDLASSDFTIEAWVFPTTQTNAVDGVFGYGVYATMLYRNGNTWTWEVGNGSSNYFTITATCTPNTWQHVALTRSGNTFTFWINGVSAGTNSTSGSIATASKTLSIGYNGSSSQLFTGYISNFRIVKGTAVYTSAFTPPTTPLTAITNTSLLTCQSNRFRDASTNNFAVTASGDVRVTPFSPYAPTAPYSAATNGGSMYFDGTGDYLSVPTNAAFSFGTGDLTIECWLYMTSYGSANQNILDFRGSAGSGANIALYLENVGGTGTKQLRAYDGTGDAAVTANNFALNTWTHVAITRSSNSFRFFVNGTQVGSTTTVSTNYSNTAGVFIGAYAGNSANFFGYLSDFRVVKGTAVYTAAFTPPTAPVTAITNTSLLVNGTNAAIIDSTAGNDLETVGNAQISTSVKKFGTGSIAFDGSGDYLSVPNNPAFEFGTGNFTIECWFYIAGNSALNNSNIRAATLFGCFPQSGTLNGYNLAIDGSNTTTGTGLVFENTASGTLYQVAYTGTVSQNAWHHIAVVRSGTTTTIYFNGTSVASATLGNQTVSNYSNATSIGRLGYAGYINEFNGYIDDLRITKGVARYTANFTPPTAAFPDQ